MLLRLYFLLGTDEVSLSTHSPMQNSLLTLITSAGCVNLAQSRGERQTDFVQVFSICMYTMS